MAAKTKKILLAGATGMVGQLVRQQCIEHPDIQEIISLVRTKSSDTHAKVTEVVVTDFTNYEKYTHFFEGISVIYFCIGVYTGAVDRQRFRAITVDYPVALAKAVFSHSPEANFCLLSGSGADRTEQSKMMFAKDKGAAENQLSAIGFANFYSFRPGYIYPVTPRKEPNFSYRLARWLYPLLKLMGPNASITSEALAKAMFGIGLQSEIQEVFENKDMLNWLAINKIAY